MFNGPCALNEVTSLTVLYINTETEIKIISPNSQISVALLMKTEAVVSRGMFHTGQNIELLRITVQVTATEKPRHMLGDSRTPMYNLGGGINTR